MGQDLVVVVSSMSKPTKQTLCRQEWKERGNLARKIEEKGFPVERTLLTWPRNHWIFYQEKYYCSKDIGQFGDHGEFITSLDLLLVSDHLNEGIFYLTKDQIKQGMQEHYPGEKFAILPAAKRNGTVVDLDLSYQLFDSGKLLVVDSCFEREIPEGYNKIEDYFTELAEKEGISVSFYDSSADNCFSLFPLNSLVLPYNGGEIVFVNSWAENLMGMLKDRGVDVVKIDMQYNQKDGGSIGCCTNLKRRNDLISDLYNPQRDHLS